MELKLLADLELPRGLSQRVLDRLLLVLDLRQDIRRHFLLDWLILDGD